MKNIFISILICGCTCDWLKACNTKHSKHSTFTFDSDITRSCHSITGQSIVACVLCNQFFNDQFMNESLLYHFIFGSFENFHTVLQHEKQCIIKSSSKIQNRIEHEYFMHYFNAMRKRKFVSISQTGKNINQRVQLRTIVQTVNSQWLSGILQFILQTNDVYLQIYKLTITHALNYNILFAHAFEFTLDTISTNQHGTRI